MTGKTLLHPGDSFPALIVSLPGGRTVHLPNDLSGRFGAGLLGRRAWCPYCNAQLGAFQRPLDGPAQAEASMMMLLVNGEATTRDLIAWHGLRFPVSHSAGLVAAADVSGAFVHPDPPFLQSAGFVLDPGGRAIADMYSSGAIGPLVPHMSAVTSDGPPTDATRSARRLRALIAIGHCEARLASLLRHYGRRNPAVTSPGSWRPAGRASSTTGQRPLPSMTTTSTIPATRASARSLPRAAPGRRLVPARPGVTCTPTM